MTATEEYLGIETSGFGDRVEIQLAGDLDVETAPLVAEHLQAAFATDAAELVIDATELEFVDSSGLGLLLTVHKRSAAEGKGFSIRGVRPQLLLLQVTGLSDVFMLAVAGGPPTPSFEPSE